MNQYHLFAAEDWEDHPIGIQAYRGRFTPEEAYKMAVEKNYDWAQLVGQKADKTLYEWASLTDRDSYLDDDHRVTMHGWITNGGVFMEMERRYQKRFIPEPIPTAALPIPDHMFYGAAAMSGHIVGFTGIWNPTRWVESDPF